MITTIDSNPQITYSEVSYVFQQVEKYRAKFLEKGRREITLPFKKYSDTYDMEIYFPNLVGVQIEIVVPLEDGYWGECFYLQWETTQGEKMYYVVNLASLKSNLGKGYVGSISIVPRLTGYAANSTPMG